MDHGELLDKVSERVELSHVGKVLFIVNVGLPAVVSGLDHFLGHLQTKLVDFGMGRDAELDVLIEHPEGSLDALAVPTTQVLVLPGFGLIHVLL